MKNYFIIHGTFGHNKENWFGWLEETLKSMGFDVYNFKNLCKERICFYAKNDPYIKLEALQDFARSIEAKELVYDNAGHFNASAGYTEFKDIEQYL